MKTLLHLIHTLAEMLPILSRYTHRIKPVLIGFGILILSFALFYPWVPAQEELHITGSQQGNPSTLDKVLSIFNDDQKPVEQLQQSKPYRYAGPPIPPEAQKWVRELFIQQSADPILEQAAKGAANWNELAQAGYPLRFMIGPKMERNPFTFIENTLGVQLNLSAYLTKNKNKRPPIIVFAVEQDSPAWQTGIRVGHRLLKYNSTQAEAVDWNTVLPIFSKKSANLTLQQPNGLIYHVNLIPRPSLASAELWEMANQNMLLRIRSFSIQTPQRIYSLMDKIQQSKKPKRIMIDLRTPCGEMQYMREVAWILNGGKSRTIAHMFSKIQSVSAVNALKPAWADTQKVAQWDFLRNPIIILNKVSALTATILANELENSRNATLLGETTDTKTTYSQTFNIPNTEFTVTFPTQRYEIAGRRIPITPHQSFNFDELSAFYIQQGVTPF